MDQVEVIGRYREAPLLRLVGKCDHTSDLVGENLSAAYVQQAVDRALAEQDLAPQQVMLVPQCEPTPHYALPVIDQQLHAHRAQQTRLAAALEVALRTPLRPGMVAPRGLRS